MKNKKISVLDAIGNTPLVELSNLNENPRVKICGKLEGCNPGGSVKDRPAFYMIMKAEESGELTREKTILEPTSGNTGIALAMIGAAKGYHVKLVMPDCVSLERLKILEGVKLGADDGQEGAPGALRAADPDEYLPVLTVRFDQGFVPVVGQHHAAAPIGVLVNIRVHAHDKARNDAAGQHVVMVLESQRVIPVAGVGFFFGQQVGDQELFVREALKIKTEFKLAHHVHDEQVLVPGVFPAVQNLVELSSFQNPLALK